MMGIGVDTTCYVSSSVTSLCEQKKLWTHQVVVDCFVSLALFLFVKERKGTKLFIS